MIDLHMKVKVGVDKNVFDGDIKEILHINEGNLNDEFIRQPSLYAWFAALQAYANAEYESMKLQNKVLFAKLSSEKRSEMSGKREKVTDAKVEQEVQQDKRFCVSQEELIEKRKEWEIVKAIVDALSQRKDMLVQLGSNKRQEFFTDGVDIKKVRENYRS